MADQAIINKLASQILGQGLTSQWKGTGHGSAQKNAEDMAKIMADIGITDIKQFGKVTKTVDAAVIPQYERVVLGYDQEGNQIVKDNIIGYTDQNGNTVDASLVKSESVFSGGEGGVYETVYTAPVGKQEVFGNKLTGQEVANTYGERQTGNAFGGTFAGSGNTGYRVQFTPDGTPIFYTTYATSNDLAMLLQDLGPIGQIGLALATGGLTIPQQIAAQMAVQVLSGAELKDVVTNAAISFAGSQIPGMDFMKEGASFIQDLGLSETVTKTLVNSFQNAAVSAGTALLKGENIVDAALRGGATGGVNGAVNAILGNIDLFGDLSKTQKKLITNAVTGVLSGKTLNQVAINTAVAAANAEIAQQRKLNAPLDAKAISELTPEEKAIYDEYGTKGLKYTSDINRLLAGIDSGSSENTDSGLSNQDILDMIYGGTDAGGNITDTTGLDTGETIPDGTDTTGLDEGPIIPGGTETVTITDGKDGTIATDVITKSTDLGNVNVTACGEGKVRNAAGICVPIDCGDGKYWDPVTKQCELKKVETVDITDKTDKTDLGTVTVTACGPGKVRNAAGICVDIDCGEGKYWDATTNKCELKKVDEEVKTTLTCGANEEKSPDGLSCLPKCGPGYKRGPDGITCVKDDEIVITACPSGQERNAAGKCVPINCGDGKYWDPITEQCEVTEVECAPGFHKDATGLCVADDDEGCKPGFESVNGKCVPVCKDGYIRNLATGVCELATKECPAGQTRNAEGKCVPITTTTPPAGCPPGQTKNAAGVCVPIKTTTTPTTPSFVPTGIAASTETTSPIYAGPMGDFDLFATLPELLADDTDKEDKKKTTRQTQQTTKMATGGHLDDLLAEQMTVDDLLNLLR